MLIGQLWFSLDDSILTQRTLSIRIGPADVSLAMDQVAKKLRSKHQIGGFRKGKAPMSVIRKHFGQRISAEAFQELKHNALDQVFKHPDFKPEDQPFLPPEVMEPDKPRLRYGEPLEFVVKYMVDPAGVTRQPQQPDQQQGAVMPGSANQHPALCMPGQATGPKLPTAL